MCEYLLNLYEKQTNLSHTWDNHGTCTRCLSLPLLVRLNKDKNTLIYSIVMSRSVETFKAACLLYQILLTLSCLDIEKKKINTT